MRTTKNIMLCADDYGYNDAVSSGIRDLIAKNRLSATSCMINMPDCKADAQLLNNMNFPVSKGLHFNLTEGFLISEPGKAVFNLKELIFKSHTGQISLEFILCELHAQLDVFQQLFGQLPDFIDGHQHIHQFPVIRRAMMMVYKARLAEKCWFRSTFPLCNASNFRMKSMVITATGGWYFSRMLQQQAVARNAQFSGIYDFSSDTDYRKLFRSWLSRIQDKALIMCHPGLLQDSGKDEIAHARYKEYIYFESDAFLEDCREFKIIYSKRSGGDIKPR